MLMGFAAGILAVAQTYFIVWLVSGIFTIFIFILRLGKTIKQATLSSTYMLIGGIFGILTMLAPVYKELPRFAGWLTRIVTHQGLYGTGESGIYTLAMIPISISYWWATIRPMMLILFVNSNRTWITYCVDEKIKKQNSTRNLRDDTWCIVTNRIGPVCNEQSSLKT